MFGKGKAAQSENAKFVMAKGRAAGNVKRPSAPKPKAAKAKPRY